MSLYGEIEEELNQYYSDVENKMGNIRDFMRESKKKSVFEIPMKDMEIDSVIKEGITTDLMCYICEHVKKHEGEEFKFYLEPRDVYMLFTIHFNKKYCGWVNLETKKFSFSPKPYYYDNNIVVYKDTIADLEREILNCSSFNIKKKKKYESQLAEVKEKLRAEVEYENRDYEERMAEYNGYVENMTKFEEYLRSKGFIEISPDE